VAALVDERRHAPGGKPLWNERWDFAVVAPGCSWALYARLALFPNLGRSSWWLLIARQNDPLLLVREDTLELPRAGSFEVRGPSLWADLHCHAAMQRWQVNFEGVAVALDDPNEVHRGERGDLVPVEFEFEWEASAPWSDLRDGYQQRCEVVGDAEIRGSNSLSLPQPTPGVRSHEWGGGTQ
jgi:hypothetical protein